MKKLLSTAVLAFGLIVSSLGLTALTSQTEVSAATKCRYYTLGQGSSGTCVRYAQTLLHGPGNQTNAYYTASIAMDGQFGPATKTAARKFQSASRLSADGVVGPNTWRSLCNAGGQSNNASWVRIYNTAYNASC